ncbi:MAG: hypothetical protein WC295_12185 [Methanoregula sp.]|jgi:hypothetical protein
MFDHIFYLIGSETMKILPVCILIISLLLVAGCTSAPAQNTSPVTVPQSTVSAIGTQKLPASLPTIAPGTALPMNAEVALGSAQKPFNVSIDSIEVDPQTEPGKRTVTIYVGAKNTGDDLLMLTWFSKLTDATGKSYGGIGVSHAGSGARTRNITPNWTEMARDYVVVDSDEGFAALANGAILDVYFIEQPKADGSTKPDYHTAWVIDPGVIR